MTPHFVLIYCIIQVLNCVQINESCASWELFFGDQHLFQLITLQRTLFYSTNSKIFQFVATDGLTHRIYLRQCLLLVQMVFFTSNRVCSVPVDSCTTQNYFVTPTALIKFYSFVNTFLCTLLSTDSPLTCSASLQPRKWYTTN